MKKLYVPEGITGDFKYIVPGNGYYDLYNTNYLSSNSIYTYYRFYNSVDSDIYQVLQRSTSYGYGDLNAIEIVPTNNFIYRNDFTNICIVSFIFIFGIIVLFNIITSFIKKGGLLGGLI